MIASRSTSCLAALFLIGIFGFAQEHPHPRTPPITFERQCPVNAQDGDTIKITSPESLFPKPTQDPFVFPPGTNFLPTIYQNVIDGLDNEVPNTLPSTPNVPYNLHDGEPVVTTVNRASPTDDLNDILDLTFRNLKGNPKQGYQVGIHDAGQIERAIDFAINILEGLEVPNRAYSGFPLLHYNGPDKYKKVIPIKDENGVTIGGNVDVHQIWYDQHIEADCSLLDVSEVLDVPYTVTYTVDVLNRGHDDFSPFVMYTDNPERKGKELPDCPGRARVPMVGFDASFFPMEDGTRTVVKIKMAPGKYLNLTYTWGWRMHPPRIQAMENATKLLPNGQTPYKMEVAVFGPNPGKNEQTRLAAIGKLGDLAPAKRMWNSFRKAAKFTAERDWARVDNNIREAREAFRDWKDRTRLPSGLEPDPDSDITIAYLNNTLYGQLTKGGWVRWPDWTFRGKTLKVTIHNGDYFKHAYANVDFGGARGWENQFKSSVKVGGSGCWFTFGRTWWQPNMGPVVLPPAGKGARPPVVKEHIDYRYEPSRRLRFYQYDPLHHDVAIYSVH